MLGEFTFIGQPLACPSLEHWWEKKHLSWTSVHSWSATAIVFRVNPAKCSTVIEYRLLLSLSLRSFTEVLWGHFYQMPSNVECQLVTPPRIMSAHCCVGLITPPGLSGINVCICWFSVFFVQLVYWFYLLNVYYCFLCVCVFLDAFLCFSLDVEWFGYFIYNRAVLLSVLHHHAVLFSVIRSCCSVCSVRFQLRDSAA